MVMNSAALLSCLALVGIQVVIGLVYSLAGQQGQYAFSQASALTIAEFLKFLISTCLFFSEDTKSPDYKALPTTSTEFEIESDNVPAASTRSRVLGLFGRANEEIPNTMKVGFAVLACLYGVNNHLSFLLFLLADSGTISLIKSGSTFTTALVLLMITGQNQAGRQWFAIIMQVVGIIITQTDFSKLGKSSTGAETLYPLSTYGLLFLSAAITAVSSVANERLCKSTNNNRKISLHAQNMFLYAAGAVINLSIYVLKSQSSAGFAEPGFFSGYNSFSAMMVVVSNTVIGLAITAVYKHANAVIKCLAMAFATGILLILGFLLFAAPITVATIPGALLIFLGTYLYVTCPKPVNDAPTKATEETTSETVNTKPKTGPSLKTSLVIFFLAYCVTLALVYYFSWKGLQVRQSLETAKAAAST